MRNALIALMLLAAPAEASQEATGPKVLSLGGAVTEIVFALDRGPLLVGIDLTSRFPSSVASLPRVGYLRALGAEGVLSLSPELVLASADAGPSAALRQIEAAGVQVVSLPESYTQAAALERIRLIGDALGQQDAANAMIATMRGDLAQVQADIANLPDRPRVLFLLSAGRGTLMTAGDGTAAAAMVTLAGAVNAITGLRGYRALSTEAALAGEPDWIITTIETVRNAGGVEKLLALTGLAQSPAGRAKQVAAFDALYLLGFGPRLAQAQRDLALALHPGAHIRPLPDRPWAVNH